MENQQVPLSQLFGSVVNSMQENQQYLNSLDERDGDTGDNALYNFQVAGQAVQAAEQQGMDVEGQLRLAARALREQGHGQLAQLYASGFENSAGQYQGRAGLTMGDFGSLVQGLSGGMSQAGARPRGEGSPLEALLPALLGYMVAKQRGASDRDAILSALTGAAGQSGMLGGARSGKSPGGGMGNVLGTLLGGMLGGGMGGGAAQGRGMPPQPQANDPLADLLGGLLGGGMAQGGGMPQGRGMPPQPQANDPLADLLGGLLGGGMTQGGGMPQGRGMPPQPQANDPLADLLGGLLGGGMTQGGGTPQGRGMPQQRQGGDPLADLLGGLLGGGAAQGGRQRPMHPDEGTVLDDSPRSADEGAVLANLSQGMSGGGHNIFAGETGQAMPDPGAAASATFIEGILRGFLGGATPPSAGGPGVGSAPPSGGKRSHRKRL